MSYQQLVSMQENYVHVMNEDRGKTFDLRDRKDWSIDL